jgi:hypothetical protein
MAREVTFKINTTQKDARWLKEKALADAFQIEPSEVVEAVEHALQPALWALRKNVLAAKVRTGRLRSSPGTVVRKYGGKRRLTVVGLVGYKSGVAPHSPYLELGTPPRAGRGKVVARRYAWLAYFHNKQAMKQTLQANLEAVMQNAIDGVE